MCSVGAATAAQAGRGNRLEAKGDSEYQVILPQLPTGRIVSNTVFLHGDVKARPFRVEDFRDMLARVGMLPDVIALGAYQINHVWAATFKNAEATKKMLAAGEQEVKGRRCLVIDPQDHQVRLKLHWLLHGVEDEDVRAAFATFGKVIEISKERWRVQGVLDKGSTTRVVTLKLKSGVTLEDLPHQIRVAGELALLVAPGRPMQCLRCHCKERVTSAETAKFHAAPGVGVSATRKRSAFEPTRRSRVLCNARNLTSTSWTWSRRKRPQKARDTSRLRRRLQAQRISLRARSLGRRTTTPQRRLSRQRGTPSTSPWRR